MFLATAVMAEEKAQKFTQEHDPHDAVVYAVNYSAHRQGITPVESTQVYDKWITYDQDLSPERYRGPLIAAEAVGETFPTERDSKLIIDVAAGTGLVGEELWKLGFRQLDCLDPSPGMLKVARRKNLYLKEFCCYLDEKRLPIDDDTYDCAVIAGGMGEGHIPTAGLYQLARIVKPGGLVCIVMREEYLQHVAEYRGRLEETMKDMELNGIWRMVSRTVVPKYSFDNNGIVFMFVVC